MQAGMSRAEKGKLDSAKGFANEARLLGALLSRGYNASSVNLPHSPYDIVVELETGAIVRIQVKTVSPSNSVSFTGGTRGGVDRDYKSDEKRYVQDTRTSDIVVGIKSNQPDKLNGDQVDFYFIPTLFVEKLGQGSLSVSRVPNAKNRWDLLERCKDEGFVQQFFSDVRSRGRNSIYQCPLPITLP